MQAIFLGLFWVLFFLFSLFCVLELCLYMCVCYCGSLSSNTEIMFEFLVYISHTHIFYILSSLVIRI